MKETEMAHLLANEQYGSCHFKDATQCLNKRLWYIWLWKEPAALCLNDAKSCYNCIALLVAALFMCQLGMSKPLVFSMMNNLWRMHHHTQMTHADLMHYASQDTWEQPVAGIGQHNSDRLAIWAAVSPPYLPLWRKMFLAQVSCAMALSQKSIGSIVFVDDINLCVLGQPTAMLMVWQMQASVANWEGLLRTIVPNKCFGIWLSKYGWMANDTTSPWVGWQLNCKCRIQAARWP